MPKSPRCVFVAESLVDVAHVRNLLQAEGIACHIRNEHLGAVMGEVPFLEVRPEVWLDQIQDLDEALALIQAAVLDEAPTGPAWRCRQCGTRCEPQFAVCWQCGQAQDD